MHKNIQFAENEMIDYFAYSIKAEEARYNYLIKMAKQRKLNYGDDASNSDSEPK